MRPFVVYWNNMPAPYMVDRFNALADRNNIEFQAWFNDRTNSDRSWDVDESNWHFRYRYVPVLRIAGRTLHWPAQVFGRRPDALIMLYAKPVFIAGWVIARIRGTKTGFRVLTTFDTWVKRSRLKTAVKRFMFKRADAIETPGEDGRRFAIECGARPDRIYYATHTVDIVYYQERCVIGAVEREALRAEWGVTGTVFLYVGRLLIHDKGLDYLLEAFRRVQRQCPDVSLLFAGNGRDEMELRQWCVTLGIRNTVFTGFQKKDALARLYALADAFVFPTIGDPYGIVVEEAMACSLPVISTSAAGEISSRIEEGVNGYIVPPQDSAALAARMLQLAQNPDLRARMGKVSLTKVLGHTPEQWAQDFERIVDAMLSKKNV